MQDINDINPPLEISFNFNSFIIMGIIALAIIITLLYLIFKAKKTPKKYLSQIEQLSAEERVLEVLKIIEKDKLIEENKIELFYLKITILLKDYLSEKTKKNIESFTTKELSYYLHSIDFLSRDFIFQMDNYLKKLEYIKFSQKKDSQNNMQNSLNELKSIIISQIR